MEIDLVDVWFWKELATKLEQVFLEVWSWFLVLLRRGVVVAELCELQQIVTDLERFVGIKNIVAVTPSLRQYLCSALLVKRSLDSWQVRAFDVVAAGGGAHCECGGGGCAILF